jgi:dephospho-CoA kinase
LAGGIASGKSTVAVAMAELGARVIDADRLNHEILDTPEVREELYQWWGESVFTDQGRTNREAIRKIVQSNPDELRRLESLVHPRIAARSDAMISAWGDDPDVKAIVWDAPLLFETGLHHRCDCIVFVDAEPAVRRQRLQNKRGWTAEDVAWVEKSQKSLDFKKARADYIIENNSSEGSLRSRARELFSHILSAWETAHDGHPLDTPHSP